MPGSFNGMFSVVQMFWLIFRSWETECDGGQTVWKLCTLPVVNSLSQLPGHHKTLPTSPIHNWILLVLRCFFQKMRGGRLSQWLPAALKAIWASKTSQGRKWPDITQSNSSEWKLAEFTSLSLFPEHGYDSLNRLPVCQFFANNKKID